MPAERRLVTVLFCDLVGSSKLTARLDPEDYAALLVAYRKRCAAAVARNGGFISSYVGDGVLACFGYPRALGRDAHSAVACGLEIAREVVALARGTALPGNAEIAVRIGIETGLVVAGQLGLAETMERDALTGLALPVAARLEEIAPPNGVVIGDATQELVASDFLLEELPAERLQRLPTPSRAFLVLGPVRPQGRRTPLTRRRAPFANREAELDVLRARWAEARAGRGQTVLLSGEPGIGKSRLVQELIDGIGEAPHALVILACTPQTAATALHPAIEALRATLVTEGEAAGAVSPAALAVITAGLPEDLAVPVLAEALGLGQCSIDLAPRAKRRLLMRAIEAWLLRQADQQPLLIVAEDLHWADPSLIELLQAVAELVPARRAMLLATYRSHLILPWPDRPTTFRLALGGLSHETAERLLDALLRQPAPERRDAILRRAGGVPLFLEEFALADGGPTVPRTLQQLFTARLDMAGEAKSLVQRAAVLGREAEQDLLVAFSGLAEPVAEERLARLAAAEILVPTGSPPATTFAFRHALLQEAAYESLLLAERRRLHKRAAALLAERRPHLAERRPELLAEHYALAGEQAVAARLFSRAARQALAASALAEAELLARRGLECAATLPAPQRTEPELELQVLLGHVLIARRGYASSAVQEAFEKALALAGAVPDEDSALPMLRGLATFYQVRGPLSKAAAISARLVAAAERSGDACMLADAWRRQAWNQCCMGQLAEAEAGFARALAAFDPARHEEHIAVAGNDPHVLALANLCWLDLSRHGVVRAALRAKEAVATAKTSPHAVSACYGFVFAAMALQQAGRWEEALRLAERARWTAEEKGFAYWSALSQAVIGRDQVHRGAAAAAWATIARSLESYRETQGELLRPFILSVLAEAHLGMGAPGAAENALREAIAVAHALEAGGFVPGLLLRLARLIGSPDRQRERSELLRMALATAQKQGADATALEAEKELRRDGR